MKFSLSLRAVQELVDEIKKLQDYKAAYEELSTKYIAALDENARLKQELRDIRPRGECR